MSPLSLHVGDQQARWIRRSNRYASGLRLTTAAITSGMNATGCNRVPWLVIRCSDHQDDVAAVPRRDGSMWTLLRVPTVDGQTRWWRGDAHTRPGGSRAPMLSRSALITRCYRA